MYSGGRDRGRVRIMSSGGRDRGASGLVVRREQFQDRILLASASFLSAYFAPLLCFFDHTQSS